MKIPLKLLFALLLVSLASYGCLSFDGDDDDGDSKVVVAP